MDRSRGYIQQTGTKFVLLALAGVGLFATLGCGGGDDSGGQAATTTPPTAADSTTETTSISEAQAEELVSSTLLRLTDFPTGWRAQPSEEEEACAGIDQVTERYDVLAKADSQDFIHGDTKEASSSAGLFNDEQTAREAMNYLEAAIQSKEFRDCLNDFLREQADENVTFGDVQVGQVSFPPFGDRSSAWEVAIPVKSQGLSITAFADAVFILRSNALGVLVFTDFLSPFDEQMRENLARLVAERIAEAVEEIS